MNVSDRQNIDTVPAYEQTFYCFEGSMRDTVAFSRYYEFESQHESRRLNRRFTVGSTAIRDSKLELIVKHDSVAEESDKLTPLVEGPDELQARQCST